MYVDTDIFYALIKTGDRHAEFAEKIMREKGLYTSAITLLELEIVIRREISDELSKQVVSLFLKKFPNTEIVDFTQKVHAKSQSLRQEFDLGVFDSVHVATALLHDKHIASTDTSFDRVKGLKRTGKEYSFL